MDPLPLWLQFRRMGLSGLQQGLKAPLRLVIQPVRLRLADQLQCEHRLMTHSLEQL
jgi:hypothetical protein